MGAQCLIFGGLTIIHEMKSFDKKKTAGLPRRDFSGGLLFSESFYILIESPQTDINNFDILS